MVVEQEIVLNKEYTVSKITGRWGVRRRIQRLGIEPERKVQFLSHSKSGQISFRFVGTKKKKKLPASNLHFIKFLDSHDPELKQKLHIDSTEIFVDIFKSDITQCINLFEGKDRCEFEGYQLYLNNLPSVSTIQGEDYDRKKLRNKVLTNFPDIFVGVIDYKNLESDLFLVSQFIDMDAKIILVLQNFDEENFDGNPPDFDLLSKLIGIPIIRYSESTEDLNVEVRNEILHTIIKTHNDVEPFVRHVHVNYGREIESSISVLKKYLKSLSKQDFIASPRFLALGLLEKDPLVLKLFEELPSYAVIKSKAKKEISRLEGLYNDHIFTIIKKARKAYINGALCEISAVAEGATASRKLDKILTHKYFGIPIFIAFMALTFYATFELGKYPRGWLELGVNWFSNYIDRALSPSFIKDLIINGAIDGVGGVLVFLPNIFILFFFIGLLESTGYMSRAAFLMDKYMHRIGLHGKSFIPMIMGFGCTVPAIMSTRIMENKRDRILTMMIVPFMSCSARLPVYILLISAFFPEHPVLMLFGIYMFGILLALIVSVFFSKTILKQKEVPYIMELLPYRKPTAKLLFSYTWDRGKEYLKKIAGIILIGSVLIWLLGYFPKNVEYVKDYDKLIASTTNVIEKDSLQLLKTSEHHEKSYIGQVGKFIEPSMKPLGFDWKMSVSILTGIVGKEITVSTMGVLYQANDAHGSGALQDKLKAETYTSGPKAGEKVFNPVVALAFIMFVLIYFPCIAVISAIWKESKKIKWAIFSAVYTTTIAWVVAFGVYQIGKLFF